MANAAETERIKLRANYRNNLAVGVLLGGVFLPLFTLMAKNIRPTSIEGQLAIATLIAALGYLLRSSADKETQRIPD